SDPGPAFGGARFLRLCQGPRAPEDGCGISAGIGAPGRRLAAQPAALGRPGERARASGAARAPSEELRYAPVSGLVLDGCASDLGCPQSCRCVTSTRATQSKF